MYVIREKFCPTAIFESSLKILGSNIGTVKSKQKKFPAKNSSSAFDCFDWLRSWIEAADWLMVQKFKIFGGFLKLRLLY